MPRMDWKPVNVFSPSQLFSDHPSIVEKGSSSEPFCPWADLPDSLLLHIFCFLSSEEVRLAAEVCRKWYRLSQDEMLWKRLLQETYSVSNKVKLPMGCRSWRSEFRRLYQETPVIKSQVLKEHTDEVLHVAFSHDGRFLASSSKDCSVTLWSAGGDCVTMQNKIEFVNYGWQYVQYCEFNADDTLLLVSGVNTMRGFSFHGEIFICSLQGLTALSIIGGITSVPYDVFGAWLTDRCYISGSLDFMEADDNLSVSELWANSVDEPNERQICFCRVINHDRSSVRTVLVARPTGSRHSTSTDSSVREEVCLIFTHGTVTYTPHEIVFKWSSLSRNLKGPTKLNELLIKKGCVSGMRSKGSEETASNSKDSCTGRGHRIETQAHIIGMALSPDHDFLYVNCRPWNPQHVKGDPKAASSPPEISSDIHLRAYSLSTYQLLCVHTGHQAFTPNKGCFFIFLNVAEKLVVSGAEDNCAHVWDRHYGVKLATLKGHSSVVNSVAINPANPNMAVSASDDHTIIVWKSRQQAKFHSGKEERLKTSQRGEDVPCEDVELNETEV